MSSTKSKPSHIYSSISVAIVMFLLGIFLLIFLHAHNLTSIIKEKMDIVAELTERGSSDEALQAINNIAEVRSGSATLRSKEDASKTMGRSFNMEFAEDANPFRDVITFNVKASDYSLSSLEKIRSTLENNANIEAIYFEDLTIQNIRSNLNKMAYAIFGIGLIFVFLAIIIIRNTINLSMYADRHEIKTMELVGARWGFIKMPYIKTSVLVGFRAFIIAAISIIGLLIASQVYFPLIWEIINFIYVAITLITIALMAIIIPAITCNSAANKYLKLNMEAIYE